MKKTVWLTLILMLLCVFALSACDIADTPPNSSQQTTAENGDANSPAVCQHTFGDWTTVKQATCKEEGTLARTCSKCSETEEESIQKSETHTPVTDAAIPATCKDTGLTEGSHCSVCNKVFVEQTTVPKTEDHTPVADAAVPATCKDTGLTEGSHCFVCNKVFVAQTVVPKTENHTPVTDAAVPATCKDTGLTEGSHCSVCNLVLVAQTSTPKSEDHSYINGYCSCGLTVISENLILQASEGLVFEAIAGGYSLAGIGTCTDEFLIIPAMHNGKQVVEISAYALMDAKTFKKVFIPSTISKIGSNAFTYCSAMTEIIFAESSQLSTIAAHAFYNSGLVSIVLPEGVKTLERAAFHSCKSLQEITLPSTLKTIGDNAFRYSSALSKVYIRDVDAWCQISFKDKYSNPAYLAKNLYSTDGELITFLDISEGVTSISAFAFYEVKSIKKIAFPKSLKKISTDAFYRISGVEMHITDLAAWCNMDIKSASTLPGGTLYLNEDEIVNLMIPNTVTSIGAYVFSGISSIKTVTMHDNVTSIGIGAFRSCKNLEQITLSNGLTALPKELFYGNTKLKSVTIPETIVKIDEYAFYSCSSMSSVFIPNAVTYIGQHAFDTCTALEEFVFECKQGWTFVYATGTTTIYSDNLATSFGTIAEINRYNYGYWQRA